MIKVKTYWFVIRQHQPITTFILIWPLLWALLIAGAGGSSFDVIIILAIGAFLANTAACILDDISEISRHASRLTPTKNQIGGRRNCAPQRCLGSIFYHLHSFNPFASFNKPLHHYIRNLRNHNINALPICENVETKETIFCTSCQWVHHFDGLHGSKWLIVIRRAWMLFLVTICWTFIYDSYYQIGTISDDGHTFTKALCATHI